MATTCPFFTSRLIPSKTTRSPNDFFKLVLQEAINNRHHPIHDPYG
ncbi:hypothetical protein CGLO_13073 [Colletotrichum gloeosporioides Cg-14]|uniref:Uncharacterized protein n=1 Tax=Colletotrichum gloeosporioides (strain Cg-14) TaxID=1237896 RepID=T0L7Z7_COLGC|nr:hypothetical protein CGLO_13073 [Colletotrichum gloeosporioides Cg-14]